MPDTIDYSIASLHGFSQELPVISQMPVKTAQTIGTSIRAVLKGVSLADDLDVRTIDIADVLDRFEDVAAGTLTVHSLQTYRAGFRQGLDLFLRWQAKDPQWDPGLSPQARHRRALVAGGDRVVLHTFPVRTGITTRLALPVDLTAAEADRLVQFIRSLVVAP
jgi:hypothetical protein